jgi:hypothetical protein
VDDKGLHGPADQVTFRSFVNMCGFAALCVASTVTPFFRKRFGSEALGFNGFFALVILCFVAEPAGPAGRWYVLGWFLCLVTHRIGVLMRWLDGVVIHSHYAGDPWLARLICRNDTVAKWVIEPLFVGGVGWATFQVNVPLGTWWMICAVALVLVQSIEWQLTYRRIQAMRNAEIEMRYFAELYRQGR